MELQLESFRTKAVKLIWHQKIWYAVWNSALNHRDKANVSEWSFFLANAVKTNALLNCIMTSFVSSPWRTQARTSKLRTSTHLMLCIWYLMILKLHIRKRDPQEHQRASAIVTRLKMCDQAKLEAHKVWKIGAVSANSNLKITLKKFQLENHRLSKRLNDLKLKWT